MSTDSASSVTQRIQSDVGMASDAGAELLREARAQLSASQIADARAWFDEVDADGGGTLDEDEVYEAMTRMLESVRAHSPMPIGIQLGHAGRKASCQAPWEGGAQLGLDEGGWRAG